MLFQKNKNCFVTKNLKKSKKMFLENQLNEL